MHSVRLEWKTFKVHLPDMENWLRSIGGQNYTGNSADDECLTLWFHEAPSEEIMQKINAQWDNLVEQSESAKVEHHTKLQRVESMARENLPYVDIADMIVAEKKMFMGRPLTLEDKEALAAKYPNY